MPVTTDLVSALKQDVMTRAYKSRFANAADFAFLIVGRSIDQALFWGGPQVLAGIDADRYAHAGVKVFLAGYRTHPAAG